MSYGIRVVRWGKTRVSRRGTRISLGSRVFRIGELEVLGTRSEELEAGNSKRGTRYLPISKQLNRNKIYLIFETLYSFLASTENVFALCSKAFCILILSRIESAFVE